MLLLSHRPDGFDADTVNNPDGIDRTSESEYITSNLEMNETSLSLTSAYYFCVVHLNQPHLLSTAIIKTPSLPQTGLTLASWESYLLHRSASSVSSSIRQEVWY